MLVERRLARADYEDINQQLAVEHERVDGITGALQRAERRELEALAELDEATAEVVRLRKALEHMVTCIGDPYWGYGNPHDSCLSSGREALAGDGKGGKIEAAHPDTPQGSTAPAKPARFTHFPGITVPVLSPRVWLYSLSP